MCGEGGGERERQTERGGGERGREREREIIRAVCSKPTDTETNRGHLRATAPSNAGIPQGGDGGWSRGEGVWGAGDGGVRDPFTANRR